LQPISVSAEGCHHRGLQRAGRSDDLRDGTGMLSDTIQQTFQRQSTGIIALQFLRHVLNGRHHVGAILKTRFSQFAGHASCHQEDACRLEQRLDDEAEAVVTQSEAFVLQDPSIAALDGPAPFAQP
jgi:hypothetical protein